MTDEHKNLRKFNFNPICSKCGCNEVTMQYVKGWIGDWNGEWILNTCANCEYTFAMHTKDYGGEND